jgi:hypothetical protein
VGTTIVNKFNHSYKTTFNKATPGFTAHSFSEDLQTLTTDFIDYTGAVLHSFNITRGKPYVPPAGPPPPPPSPPSPPSPAGKKCCHLHDAGCSSGDVCCKEKCSTPSAACSYKSASTCQRYGSAHGCEFENGLCIVK